MADGEALELRIEPDGMQHGGASLGQGRPSRRFPGQGALQEKYATLARRVADLLCGRKESGPRLFNKICFFLMKKDTRRLFGNKTFNDKYKKYEYDYRHRKGWFGMSYKRALERELGNGRKATSI